MDNLRREKLEKLLASKFKKIRVNHRSRVFSWDDLTEQERSLLIEEFSLFIDYVDWDVSIPIVNSYHAKVRSYLWSDDSFTNYIAALGLILRGDKIVDGTISFPSSNINILSMAQYLWNYWAEWKVPIEEKAVEIHDT